MTRLALRKDPAGHQGADRVLRRRLTKRVKSVTEEPMPDASNYTQAAFRPLSVYAFDPTFGRRLNNYMTVKVPYEPLVPGPVGRKIAIIDYDISNDRYYEPVNLDHPSVLIRGGLEPSEADPRFHQQMVYAVTAATIHRFEFALGREVKWRRKAGSAGDPSTMRLRIFPHAFQQANAFYDPDLRAVLFGYFAAANTDPGENLPGQTVFTCLSHDIVAHEVTHAIIDGVRPFFSEAMSSDTPAFHEAFADIVALFQHFTMREAVLDTILRTGGLLYRQGLTADASPGSRPLIGAELSPQNPLVGLAKQFGEAMGTQRALRSALGTLPNSKDIEHVFEPHSRGSILVAAVFDAYFSLYVKRTRDLLRIAGAGSTLSGSGDVLPDLADRLCHEAIKTADHILNMCIRAIDYCPPVDIQFGEFLRAIVTADSDLVPEDPWGYRTEFITAFRLRGIVPENVSSYSEDALRWCGPVESGVPLPPCNGLQYEVVREVDEVDQARNRAREAANAKILWNYAMDHAAALGLRRPKSKQDPRIQAFSYHPIYRIGPNGRLVVDFVVEFLQHREERVDPSDKNSPTFTFRGGSTVIFNHHGDVRYVVQKSIGSESRLARQREYQFQRTGESALATYNPNEPLTPLSFEAIHRGI